MKRWRWLFTVSMAVAAATGNPTRGRAELLYFTFGGRVDSVFSDGPANPPAIAPGDRFTGSFGYDPNAALAAVAPSPPTFLSPGRVTLNLGGRAWQSDAARPLYLTLDSTSNPGPLPLGGVFSVTGWAPDPGLFSPPAAPGLLGLIFGNQPGHPLPATPPARLDLSDWSRANLNLAFPSRTFAGDFGLPSFGLQGTIDELTPQTPVPAPEPGALALGLLGAVGCGGPMTLRLLHPARRDRVRRRP